MRDRAFGQGKRSLLDKLIAWVRLRKIVSMVPNGAKILDLGCGHYGELLHLLERRISRGVGIDLSVAKLNSRKIRLVEGKVDRKLPFADNSFDVVTAMALIEHVDNPKTMLREIRRVLKPNGVVLITTPCKCGKLPLEIMSKLGLVSKDEIDDHKRYYTQGSLVKVMQNVGLKDLQVKHFGIMWLNLFGRGIK